MNGSPPARGNCYGEGANLQGHFFCDRVNPIGVLTQGEGFIQIEARRGPCHDSSFAKDEAKGTSGVIATENGQDPVGKGEPAMAVSAPVSVIWHNQCRIEFPVNGIETVLRCHRIHSSRASQRKRRCVRG